MGLFGDVNGVIGGWLCRKWVDVMRSAAYLEVRGGFHGKETRSDGGRMTR
jgi:hypothetical protein